MSVPGAAWRARWLHRPALMPRHRLRVPFPRSLRPLAQRASAAEAFREAGQLRFHPSPTAEQVPRRLAFPRWATILAQPRSVLVRAGLARDQLWCRSAPAERPAGLAQIAVAALPVLARFRLRAPALLAPAWARGRTGSRYQSAQLAAAMLAPPAARRRGRPRARRLSFDFEHLQTSLENLQAVRVVASRSTAVHCLC